PVRQADEEPSGERYAAMKRESNRQIRSRGSVDRRYAHCRDVRSVRRPALAVSHAAAVTRATHVPAAAFIAGIFVLPDFGVQRAGSMGTLQCRGDCLVSMHALGGASEEDELPRCPAWDGIVATSDDGKSAPPACVLGTRCCAWGLHRDEHTVR